MYRQPWLTGSTLARDVDTAYKLGANSFLTKPNDFVRFLEIASALNGYWLWMDEMPPAERPADHPTPHPGPKR